jgi:hypothetical protein
MPPRHPNRSNAATGCPLGPRSFGTEEEPEGYGRPGSSGGDGCEGVSTGGVSTGGVGLAVGGAATGGAWTGGLAVGWP